MIKRNLTCLFGATFFSYTTLSMLIPTFPAYILDLGGDTAQIGLTWGAFTAGVLVFRPIVGRWTDQKGRRWVALLGTAIFFIAPLLYAVVQSIEWLYVIRFLHGIGSAAFTTAAVTLVTDCTTAMNRGQTLGLMGAANNLGFAFGPWMGSQIAETWGFPVMFVSAAGLALMSMLVALPIRERVKSALSHEHINYPRAVLRRNVLIPSMLLLLSAIIHTSIMTFLPVLFKERQIVSAGPYFMILGLTMLMTRVFAGRVMNARSHRPVIIFSLLGITAGVLIIVQASNAVWLLCAAIVYGIGFATFRPVLTAFLAGHTPVAARGTVFSFYEGAYDLGMSLSGVVLGMVANSFGLSTMFYVTCAIGLVGQLVGATLTQRPTREPVEVAMVLQEEESIH
jgi:MFS family permease